MSFIGPINLICIHPCTPTYHKFCKSTDDAPLIKTHDCTIYLFLFFFKSKNPVQTGFCPNRNKTISPSRPGMYRFLIYCTWKGYILHTFLLKSEQNKSSKVAVAIILKKEADRLLISSPPPPRQKLWEHRYPST